MADLRHCERSLLSFRAQHSVIPSAARNLLSVREKQILRFAQDDSVRFAQDDNARFAQE
jgi:hypothetical protein